MDYCYKTNGWVCSRSVSFSIEDGKVRHIRFEGGCDGNTQGIARLAEGMEAEKVVKLLRGIRCGLKESSCPDQLACAIEEALDARKKERPAG